MAGMSPQTLVLSNISRGVEFAFELVEDDAHIAGTGDELDASAEQCAGCTGCASGCTGCAQEPP